MLPRARLFLALWARGTGLLALGSRGPERSWPPGPEGQDGTDAPATVVTGSAEASHFGERRFPCNAYDGDWLGAATRARSDRWSTGSRPRTAGPSPFRRAGTRTGSRYSRTTARRTRGSCTRRT